MGGGASAGWPVPKLWTAPPSPYNSEGFLGWAPATPFFGHRSFVWLFAGAPFCFVVVQVAGGQVAIFHMADFFLITCTKVPELDGSSVVEILDSVGQKLGGWVQNWVGGSCPKYPLPSCKRSLVENTKATQSLYYQNGRNPCPLSLLATATRNRCEVCTEDKGNEVGHLCKG